MLAATLLAMMMLLPGLSCRGSVSTPATQVITSTATRSIPTATPFPMPTSTPSGPRVILGGVTFFVQLAVTPQQRARGLMGRKELPDDQGMLFLYESDVTPGFWMLGMLIPLDIVWIDGNGVVAGVERDVPQEAESLQPTFYFPPSPIRYVLEIKAGRAQELGVGPGSRATLVGIPSSKGS